jgi:protein involved in polysaccharide export with SLBB domain
MTIKSAFELRLRSKSYRRLLPNLRVRRRIKLYLSRWDITVLALSCALPVRLGLAQPSALASAETPRPAVAITSPSSVTAPAATPLTGVSAPTGYVLSANDQVAVEVFGEDDLRTTGRLNSEGNLSLPLLGSVHFGGLTLTQAAVRLTELYGRDYLVNPRVNVTLVGYAKRRFTVLGQVNHPGSFEMPESSPGGIDLLEAIAIAGGYTRIAAPERISVRRNDKLIKVDAKRLAKGSGGGFRVESGDTITVGESIF